MHDVKILAKDVGLYVAFLCTGSVVSSVLWQSGVLHLVLLWAYAALPLVLGCAKHRNAFVESLLFGIGTIIGMEIMWSSWAGGREFASGWYPTAIFWWTIIMIAIVSASSIVSWRIGRNSNG
jgi:hypothetical protein